MHPLCEVRPVVATEALQDHDGVAAAFRGWFEALEESRSTRRTSALELAHCEPLSGRC
jgi:hypothetical protein